MEKREKKPVVGRQQLVRRQAIGSGSTSSPPPTTAAAAAAGCNGKERKGGEHKEALRQKKLKAKKTFKWRSSNGDMNSKVEAGGSDQVCDDAVLCSLSTASFSGLVSWKRVRTLGKVAERCDAADPPVPRKLRSAINKRAGRFASASSRHVKKRRHLSAISAQISFVDQETRSNGGLLFTEQEEAIAAVLLSLSQVTSHSELTADKAIADSSKTNVASTSYSKGPTKESDQTVVLPSAANELANQSACIDKVVEQNNILPNANPVAATDPSSNKTPSLSTNEQIKDLSLGTAVNLASPSKDISNNSVRKQQKVQFDDSKCHPAQKPEAPLWLIDSNKSNGAPHEREKAKINSAQEVVPLVQTPLPCAPAAAGYLIKPSSSKPAARTNTISESANFTAPGNQNKHPLVKNIGTPKAWKRSITHVYVSHVIQMHVNKERAAASSSQSQAKPEEELLARCSRPPNGFTTSHKATTAVRDEKFYTVHFDVRVPAQQPSTGICNMGAGQQKTIVSGGSWQNLPAATASPALPAAAQHVQYLPHQLAPRPPPRDATLYPFPHLPYNRGSLPPSTALQQMPQYVCSPGYVPRASLPTATSQTVMMKQAGLPAATSQTVMMKQAGLPAATSSAMMMKQLQQLMPTQQQQQQMWQYHVSQYQPRPDATPSPASVAAAAWHGMSSSLRPMGMLAPPATMPPSPRPPQMELFCAPYQGGRQPEQLRLM